MNRTTTVVASIVICAICSAAFAMYSVQFKGAWPKSWPQELEPLRAQARTLIGPMAPRPHYEIPFATRAEFEAAWPHIVKVKSMGAPVFLVRAPDARLGTKIAAGVRIYAPPPRSDNRVLPEAPLPGNWDGPNVRGRWMNTTFVELIVDGVIVDLNHIPLPPDTPIIDERFADRRAG